MPFCYPACANYRALGCAEGSSIECPVTLSKVSARGIIVEENGSTLSCADLAAAKTAADVKALGLPCSPLKP
jgi:hypothetical protein